MNMIAKLDRKANPKLYICICGEHGKYQIL